MGPHFAAIPISSGALVDLDGTVFIQAGLFFFMFIFLYFALFRPVVRLIEARRDATDGTKERASAMKAEAAALIESVESQILDIRSSATAERNRFLETAKRQEREILLAAREKSRKVVEHARAEMNRRGDAVRNEIEIEIEPMAAAVASRILGRSLQ